MTTVKGGVCGLAPEKVRPSALDVANMVERFADDLCQNMARQIQMRLNGNAQFEAIVLHAVEVKVMALRHAAQKRAAGV